MSDYKKLLVPVDGTDVSERAMQQGIALARQLGAAITGFVVEALPGGGDALRRNRRSWSNLTLPPAVPSV